MRAPFKRVVTSLSEPRVLTGLTVTAYTALAVLAALLWPRLLPFVAHLPWWLAVVYLTPAIFLTFGVIVGIPASWTGGRRAGRWERGALIAAAGGLLGGTLFEALPLLGSDFAGILLLALTVVVLLAALARIHWLAHTYDL